MKAILYALLYGEQLTWQVSLDIKADFIHWFGQQKNPDRIWMLDPSISFGQAVTLKERLDKHSWNRMPISKILHRLQSLSEDMLNNGDHARNRRLRLLESSREHALLFLRASGDNILTGIREDVLEQLVLLLQGRSLLLDEVNQLLTEYQLTEVLARPLYYLQLGYLRGLWGFKQGIRRSKATGFSLWRQQVSYVCHRCGAGAPHMVITDCIFCETACAYCEQCLTMGRSRCCSLTVSAPRERLVSSRTGLSNPSIERNETLQQFIEPWGLSDVQAEASGKALEFMKGSELHYNPRNGTGPKQFLIWAVTGAGKTEMIFPMVHYMLARGGKVAIATPRRDVVLELKPRIEKAFASSSVVTLYGGSSERWASGDITLATTHQLMRFEQAFDLVIIDELDAFPYHNNPMLAYAAKKVCIKDGLTILLSATPPRQLQREAKSGRLPHVKVTARYHRHPLPVPALLLVAAVKKQLQRGVLEQRIMNIIEASILRGAQLFVFVPKIHMVEPLTQLLSRLFPQVITRGTSSKDAERTQKVTAFRGKETRILVTTTILERGVTIPKSDVLIMDADEPMFDAAALVQMSGRAGRSAEDPAGHVYFAAKERTRAQLEAIGQIREMNRLARKKGYLISGHKS